MLAQDIAGQDDGVFPGRVVAAEKDANGIAEGILQVFFIQQQVGEGQVDGNVALFVLHPGCAHFFRLAHQVFEHAPGVPFAQGGSMHNVEYLEPQQQLAVIVECHQLAVVDERA